MEGVGERLHRWMFDEPDANAAALAAIAAPSAYVMGRNMFGPVRGAWDLEWKGWWGDDPPYHAPVFVLTHHAREPLTMQGGTVFTFVTDGVESALEQARQAAGSGEVAIAGGAATARQYLSAGQIDELRLHLVPVVLPRHAPEVPRHQVTRTHTRRRDIRGSSEGFESRRVCRPESWGRSSSAERPSRERDEVGALQPASSRRGPSSPAGRGAYRREVPVPQSMRRSSSSKLG